MCVHFHEIMSGEVSTVDGPRHFSFSVDVDGPSFWGAWGRDLLRLSGRATLEGAARDAPLLPGSYLQIGLPFRRRLSYAVSFLDDEGRHVRFFGEKKVRYLLLPLTLNTLRGTLFVDGQRLGKATLRFRYRTLPAFLSSFRVASSRAQEPGVSGQAS